MSTVKAAKVVSKKPVDPPVLGAFVYVMGEPRVFVRNKDSSTYFLMGYATSFASYKDLKASYPSALPIYEGESVTLEF
jgi:hypothetical protein